LFSYGTVTEKEQLQYNTAYSGKEFGGPAIANS
jgi:hypothetical protein